MKVDREFSFEELPKRVRESLTEMVQKHVDQLVRDYNETLMAEGLSIGFDSCNILTEKISDAAKVTVKISAKCDSDILALYHVYPQDLYQNRLEDFDKARDTTITITHDGKTVTTTPEQMQQAVDVLEKRKAASKAVEEASQ